MKKLTLFLFIIVISGICQAQFFDDFDKKKIEGWFFFSGDGDATLDFVQKDGYARMLIDATKDKHNVYWTLIKRDVSKYLDLQKMKDTVFQLRVEAKVKVSDAPRRLIFMVNTQRTVNFHIDLMEYDIPNTSDWHTISMTTKKFDVLPDDTVYVQLVAADFGLGKYHVDVDYYRADIVNVNEAGPDKGELVPYHPPIPAINAFTHHLDVTHDALINSDFPNVNFNNWHAKDKNGEVNILTVNADQWAILRWDLGKFKNKKVEEDGLLELTTHSVTKGGEYIKAYGQDFGMEFGKIRIIEIFGGDPEWKQNEVTYNNFMQDKNYVNVFNPQMITDIEIKEKMGGKNYITIPRSVLRRMLNGTTKGLLIRPLGAINASIYASENKSDKAAKLHFNVTE